MCLIGLDVGSTGCKAIVFSEEGSALSSAYKEYDCPGSVFELDGGCIWEGVKEVLARCAKDAPAPVLAMSVSSFGESFIPIDRDGNALARAMLYTDPRGSEQCEEYRGKMGGRIERTAGARLHPMYSLPKWGYLRDRAPGIFSRTKKFLLIGSYIIYKLCGEYAVDYALAARTLAFDVVKKDWDEDILALSGVTREKLPRPMQSGVAVGRILSPVAKELGLSRDMLIATGAHDQVCAAIGAGILRPGSAVDGTGTTECITPAFDRPMRTPEFLANNYACVPHALDGMYVTYAFNFTGGALLKWYRDRFARAEAKLAKEKGISVYQLLDAQGAKEPTDLIVLPHFSGSATPDMRESARGGILGLTLNTDAPALYRALLEGASYEMAYNIECLNRSDIRIDALKAVGGGAKSDYWLGIKANVFGLKIVSLDVGEAGAAGAAMLAGVAAGVYKNLEEAAPRFVREKRAYEPDEKEHEFYLEQYRRYKRARERVIDLY